MRIRVPPSVDVLTDKPRIYSNLCTAPPWLCGNPTVIRPTMRPYSKPLTQQEGAGFCRNPLSVRRLSPRRSSTTIKRESDFDPIWGPNIQERRNRGVYGIPTESCLSARGKKVRTAIQNAPGQTQLEAHIRQMDTKAYFLEGDLCGLAWQNTLF